MEFRTLSWKTTLRPKFQQVSASAADGALDIDPLSYPINTGVFGQRTCEISIESVHLGSNSSNQIVRGTAIASDAHLHRRS